jgi:hypothetical protein
MTMMWWGKRVFAQGAVLAAVLLSMNGLVVRSASAQEFEVGVGAAFFSDLPEPFQEQYCETGAAGLGGSAAWRVVSWLLFEGSAVVTGEVGGQTCGIPGLAPLPMDTPIVETSSDPDLEGVGFFATQAAVVLEPLAGSALSPRARLGVGWIWQKELFQWQWGVGLRYRFGSFALVTDVDRWNMTIPELTETVIYRTGGGREVVSSETIDRAYSPWVLRVGVEFAFPR